MTRRVKNSLAERRLLLDFESYPIVDFSRPSPTGRRDTITTNSLDLNPQSLTLEMLMETKRQFESGEHPLAYADYSQLERRIEASLLSVNKYPSYEPMYFWRDTDYEPPSLWADQVSWPNPHRTHKYEEHRQKVKAQQEAQAAERTRKSYEELFV